MLKFIKYFVFALLIANGTNVLAQQVNIFNQYSFDPLQLNIAYAGANCTEVNLHYRNQWTGFKDAPKNYQLNAHTAFGENNGAALKINSQQAGLLSNLQATLGYAYRFNVSPTAKVHLGLGIGLLQTSLNAQKAVVVDWGAGTDATLLNANQQSNVFDSEFGAMYIGSKLKGGLSVLHLYNTKQPSGTLMYNAAPQLNSSIAYTLMKDKKVEVEPWLLHRYTVKGKQQLEGLVNVNLMKTFTVGAGYRSGYGMIALFGLRFANFKVAYSFDYATAKDAFSLGASHQIMIGYGFCRKAKSKQEPVVIVPPIPTKIEEPAKETPKEEPVKTESTKETKAVVDQPKKQEPIVKTEPKSEEAKTPSTMASNPTVDKINLIAEGVMFKVNESTLEGDKLKKLDEIAEVLKQDRNTKVKVTGHTCDIGTTEYNKVLSEDRALYVKKYLKSKGVKTSQFLNVPETELPPNIYDNNTATHRAKNRTIRFELVNKK